MVELSASGSKGPPSDEMTLADLWLIGWARRRLVAVVVGAAAIGGIALAFTMPVQYRFATVIEIGDRVVNEDIVPIESVNTVIAKLQESYIPLAIMQFDGSGSLALEGGAFKVSGSRQSQIVSVVSEGAKESASIHHALQARVADLLIQDHDRTTHAVRDNAAMLLAAAEESLALLEAEEAAAAERINLLETAIVETQERSSHVSQRIALLDEQLSAINERPDASSGTQVMLLSQQISAMMALDAELSEKADLRLRVERLNAQASLATIARKKETARRAIQYRETSQTNIQATRIVGGEAVMSPRPVAPNKPVVILVSLIVGVVIAAGLVLALDFLSKAHGRDRAIRA